MANFQPMKWIQVLCWHSLQTLTISHDTSDDISSSFLLMICQNLNGIFINFMIFCWSDQSPRCILNFDYHHLWLTWPSRDFRLLFLNSLVSILVSFFWTSLQQPFTASPWTQSSNLFLDHLGAFFWSSFSLTTFFEKPSSLIPTTCSQCIIRARKTVNRSEIEVLISTFLKVKLVIQILTIWNIWIYVAFSVVYSVGEISVDT
jgi:hypothetical protein